MSSSDDIQDNARELIRWFKERGIEPLDAISYMGCATSLIICTALHGSQRTEFTNDYVDCLWMAIQVDHSRGH